MVAVATHQLVRLGDANDFLHAGHFIERAGFDLTFVAGDANGCSLCARDGVSAIAEAFDFLADGANLLFSRVRLHHNQHRVPLGRLKFSGKTAFSANLETYFLRSEIG
jgi:hypothetical protein